MKLIPTFLFLALSFSMAQTLQVIASHSILADVVANVTGDAAEVRSLMPVGADPHSFIPRPSDLVGLARADIIFINGAGFEEGLLEAIENAGSDMNIAVASACVEMLGFADDHDEHDEHDDGEHDDHDEHEHDSAIAQRCEQFEQEMAALHGHDEHDDEYHDDHDEEDHSNDPDDHGDHGDEHEHDDHSDVHEHDEHEHGDYLEKLYTLECDSHDHEGEPEGESEDDHADEGGHNHGACDPHVWLEPHNVMVWTMLIRDTLIELDAANADTYRANASQYLETLDAFAHDVIEPLIESVSEENRVLVTNHDAFGYFAAAYDFEVVETIIPGGSTLAEPSAADVARVIDLVRARGVPAIFTETTVSDTISQQIASETGAQVAVLYSGSLSDEEGPASTYLDYMRYNVSTIVNALGGSQ
jgi:ABC-type Zn uptake system ZnuABC Zn-binding protein ZnuA